MSTVGLAYSEQLPVSRQCGPAFGEAGPPPEVEAAKKDAGRLDRRTEAMFAFAILMPVVAAYTAVAYGAYAAMSGSL